MEALMPLYMGFLLVLTRCAALCMVAPLFAMRAVPMQIRAGVALALALAVFFGAGTPGFTGYEGGARLVGALFVETILGLSAGLVARMTLEGANAAGHAISMSMGLGFGSVIDPIHGSESTALSELLAMVALGIAIGMGIHREAVMWLCRSVVELPPGRAVALAPLAAEVVAQSARAAAIGIRLAFPVMAAVTLGHAAMGVMSRAAPQINLQNVGFSVAILAGGGALYMVAPAAAELAAQSARAAFAAR